MYLNKRGILNQYSHENVHFSQQKSVTVTARPGGLPWLRSGVVSRSENRTERIQPDPVHLCCN